MKKLISLFSASFLFLAPLMAQEDDMSVVARQGNNLDYSVELVGAYGGQEGLPYLLTANKHGVLSPQGSQGYLRANMEYTYSNNSSFYVGAGVDVIGYASSHYSYYKNNFYLQQAYFQVGAGKYNLTIGSKEEDYQFVDPLLSSGNMAYSGNWRTMPGVRIGMDDFAKMMIIGDVLEAKFDIGFYKLMDGDFSMSQYEAYLQFAREQEAAGGQWLRSSGVKDAWLHKSSLFLRSPSKFPFMATVGIEHAALYGGTIHHIDASFDGFGTKETVFEQEASWGKALFGAKGDAETGQLNHAVALDARFDWYKNGFGIGLYGQHYMDDLNENSIKNWQDGLYGLELRFDKFRYIKHIIVEYVRSDSEGDNRETLEKVQRGEEVTYKDYASDFYQDERYGSYSYYGMAMGNVLLTSPIMNGIGGKYANCYNGFYYNNARGYNVGVEGEFSDSFSYRLRYSYHQSTGNPWQVVDKISNNSFLLEAAYKVKNITISPAVSFNYGKLYGNTFGALLSVKYSGRIL